ncbi:hypothetical protein DZD52_16290 [Xanthomonas nasturtii]|uniref:Uncharacterized protein n=1 Tax=Xanthomonas nasturtii TaxID=1843581 RepID=A0A3E1KG17_9XANT|nr:hypothetical protein DZD52_16290 [Xanthomonas nasturtii]
MHVVECRDRQHERGRAGASGKTVEEAARRCGRSRFLSGAQCACDKSRYSPPVKTPPPGSLPAAFSCQRFSEQDARRLARAQVSYRLLIRIGIYMWCMPILTTGRARLAVAQ